MSNYKYIFPKELIDNFDLIRIEEILTPKTNELSLLVVFKEKNIYQVKLGEQVEDYESKGFVSTVRVQDFPIRGRAVYLELSKRAWRHKKKRTTVTNSYNIKADGSKITKELSDFLKYTNQYQRRYNL